jgi:hypothetical protein
MKFEPFFSLKKNPEQKSDLKTSSTKNLEQKSDLTKNSQLYKLNSKVVNTRFIFNKEPSKIRVFKPKNEDLLKEKIKSKINLGKKPSKQFLFGFKNFQSQFENPFEPLKSENINKALNFYLIKWRVLERINFFIAASLIIFLSLFILFLSFFDTYFLIKNYKVSFSQGSYLSQEETQNVIKKIEERKNLGVLPNNQYWFLNDYTLTLSAREVVPEIISVKIIRRIWPKTAELEITTEPILLTLEVTEKNISKYWRVSKSGRIVSEDDSSVREKTVKVGQSIFLAEVGGAKRTASFKDYNLEENYLQVNRLWAVIWLWQQLEKAELEITQTILPSISDTDVVILTKDNVKLIFDTDPNKVPKEIQRLRLETVLKSDLRKEIVENKLDYIDFRPINKRIDLCYRGASCAQ